MAPYVGLLTIVLLAPASAPGQPPDLGTRKAGSDWPRFLGPTGDGVSPERGLLTPWPAHGPAILWQKKLGSGYCAPAVSRGRIFLFDRAGEQVRLRCCRSETGEELWSFKYPSDYRDYYGYDNGPRACPVVDADRVYIYGPEGMVHCLRVADGSVLWKVDTRARFHVIQNFFGVASAPVIEKDLLLVQVGGSPEGSDPDDFAALRGNGSGLVAFDKISGKVRYQATEELASYASPVLATIGERRWCFLFARGGLVGLDPATGKVDFHYPWRSRLLESVNASNPVVVGNRVFISECYGPGSALLEVRPGRYRELWTDAERRRNKRMQCHWNTPIAVGGYLYGCSGRHTANAELRCIELGSGQVLWRQRGLTRTSLLLVDGHFICLGEDGVLRLLKVNPEQYEEVSTIVLRPAGADGKPDTEAEPLLEYPCWAAPILSHGLLYVRGHDRVVCLEVIPVKR